MQTMGRKNERHSGVELLRILAGMAVIVLHFNFHPAGGGALEEASGISAAVLMLLENLCICAVNVFILVTGYFGSGTEKTKPRKLILLLLQTMIFQVLIQAGGGILNHDFSVRKMLGALLPVNYYVVLYVSLMLLAPFINCLLKHLSDKGFRTLLTISFLLFSIWACGSDMIKELTGAPLAGLNPVGLDGSSGGYTIVNFLLVYLIGAWLRRNDEKKQIPTVWLIGLLIASVAILWIWRVILPGTSWMYNNPVVIGEAVILFLLFRRMKFQNKIINKLAPASFTCYLIHEAILSLLDLTTIGASSTIKMAGLLVAVVIGIYGTSFMVMTIWNWLISLIFRDRLDRIPSISAQ